MVFMSATLLAFRNRLDAGHGHVPKVRCSKTPTSFAVFFLVMDTVTPFENLAVDEECRMGNDLVAM